MSSIKRDYVAGWLNTSIAAIVEEGLLDSCNWVLVTSLDSITDLAETGIGARVLAIDPHCTRIDRHLAVPGRMIRHAAKALNMFCGFDEVWCFDTLPQIAKPPSASIVSPFDARQEAASFPIESWLKQTQCVLGLGDGMGLNFIAGDDKFAGRFRAQVQQAPPAT